MSITVKSRSQLLKPNLRISTLYILICWTFISVFNNLFFILFTLLDFYKHIKLNRLKSFKYMRFNLKTPVFSILDVVSVFSESHILGFWLL